VRASRDGDRLAAGLVVVRVEIRDNLQQIPISFVGELRPALPAKTGGLTQARLGQDIMARKKFMIESDTKKQIPLQFLLVTTEKYFNSDSGSKIYQGFHGDDGRDRVQAFTNRMRGALRCLKNA
jgi:hypothetical protein